jgi:RNA polymerase sigma-70 factor, ECF subfamily
VSFVSAAIAIANRVLADSRALRRSRCNFVEIRQGSLITAVFLKYKTPGRNNRVVLHAFLLTTLSLFEPKNMNNEDCGNYHTLRTAIGPLFIQYGVRWKRYILAIVRNSADADDVVQEAISRVLAHNQRLESEEQVKLYLSRAIGNSALEFYHCRKREQKKLIPVKEHILIPANTANPYTCIEESERSVVRDKMINLLDKGLKRLPAKQYEALRLTILEANDHSIRDVGTTNGIPYSTLRHRAKQGLRRLRRFLENEVRSQETGVRSQNKTKIRIQDSEFRRKRRIR